jgi:hypothetical protein
MDVDGAGIYGTRGEVRQTRQVTGRLIHKRRPLAEDDVRRRRSKLVGEIMKAEGVSLGQASMLVKERALPY